MKAVIQKAAPSFKGQAYIGAEKTFRELSLESYKGRNLLLCFYPLNFTFVCPTEIQALDDRLEDFDKLNTDVLCCSVDSHHSHRAWVHTPRE